jgi:hypothetical protein
MLLEEDEEDEEDEEEELTGTFVEEKNFSKNIT